MAQLHVRCPVELGSWQTHQPTFGAPVESMNWPPTTPPRLLQSVQCGTSQAVPARSVTPAQTALAAVGIL